MPKRPGGVVLEAITIDHKSPTPIHMQVYDGIRELVLSGNLDPGLRLPATRRLAQELAVSRTTVVQAYDKLMSEGYLEGHVGSGTYVSSELPRELLADGKHLNNRLAPPTGPAPRLSARSQLFERAVAKRGPYQVRAFEPNLPAFDAFPMALWSRIAARQWRRSNGSNMAYGELAGYAPLRRAVTRYLSTARGVKCDVEQVFIVSGAHEAFTIAANLVADPGDRAWVESPGPFGVRNAVGAAGLELVPVPVDDQGLMVSEGHRRAPDPKVIVVTPSRQHPLCVTMGLNRRLELLEAAERSKSWIIEDDYDSEFRYVGRPLPALQGLDTTGRVIYVGTFSKVLFPALRLGYVVAPPSLVDPFARAIATFSRGAATPLQAVIASFIEEGHFTAHIRRMRKLYKERHDLLIEEAEKQLTGLLDVLPVESGMHAMGWLPDGMAGAEVSKKAALVGISAPSLSDYCLEPYARDGLLLGFTCVPPKEMARSVGKLREVLETANN